MELQEKDIRQFQARLLEASTYDFTDYSLTSLRRRLTKILLELEMPMEELLEKVSHDPAFPEKLVRKITVHTTELFRDPMIWRALQHTFKVAWKDKEEISIWHPGCSTGQEVYSMMMVLDELGMLDRTRILATDLNPDVLDIAARGRYKYHFNQSYLENFDKVILQGDGKVSAALKKHWKSYFSVSERHDSIQMHERLCSKPVYKKFDLAQNSKRILANFDLIVCRNVIIYFNQHLQNRVFDLFYNNLSARGMLWLGVHESMLGPHAEKFRKQAPIYLKHET